MKMRINKKVIAVLLVVIITVAIISGIYLSNNKPKVFSIDEYNQTIEEFSSCNSYDWLIEGFSSDTAVGEINTALDAKQAAFDIWQKAWGNSVIWSMPYHVYFDEQNKVWMVTGSWIFFIPGGPHILIQKDDGKILSVWHEKL